MEVFGEERSQFVTVLRPATEEVFAGGQKFPVSFIIIAVENFLLEKFPTAGSPRQDSLSQSSHLLQFHIASPKIPRP
jgi:hypothetical protein